MSESADSNPPPDEVMSMFASVWVKVEVDEVDESIELNKTKRNQKTKSTVPLRCDHCEYTTRYKNCLKIHVLGHTNKKPYSCEACSYTTRYPTSLNRHMLVQHQFKNGNIDKVDLHTYKCDICTYTSYFKWNLNAHRRKHKLEKQFKCEQCDYSTAYRHNYMKHSKVHNKQMSLYRCDKCPFVTKFDGHISRHLAKIHNEVSDKANKCDVCDFSTKTMWRLNIHKTRSRQTDVIKCAYCEFETLYVCESKKHKNKHYNEVYACKTTPQPAGNTDAPAGDTPVSVATDARPEVGTDALTAHEKTNHYVLDPNCEIEWSKIQVLETASADRPFQCIVCTYSAKFKASVQRHYQRHHTSTQNKPYKCTNCDFSTKTKDQISLHNKRSHSDHPLQCNMCKFVTFFRCQYVCHQKSHYEHKCNLCNYACKHKYEMQKHYTSTHLGKGLQCRFCDYKAARKETLASHETTHTGDKPFKCCKCNYKSLRKTLLDKHVRKTHGEVNYNTTVVTDGKIESLRISLPEHLGPASSESEIFNHLMQSPIDFS